MYGELSPLFVFAVLGALVFLGTTTHEQREGQIQAQISSAFLYYTQNIVNTFIISIIPFAPFGGSLGSVKSISHSPSQLHSLHLT